MICDIPVLVNDAALGLIIELPSGDKAIVTPEGWAGVPPGTILKADVTEIHGSFRIEFIEE